jgi:hemolysin activation/secretion protein
MSIHSSSFIASSILISLILSIAIPVNAQVQPTQITPVPNPNLDRIPQPQPIPEPIPSTPPVLTPPTPLPTPTEGSGVAIEVKKIEITGSTVFKSEDFAKLTKDIEGKSVKLQDLQTLTNAITALYLDRGYITSRAVLGEQTIVNGIVKIQIIEGSLDRIDIEGLKRLNKNYIQSRIQLGTKIPLNKNQLEDQLQLLKADSLIDSIQASLRPGSGAGRSILTLRIKESNPIAGNISIDNYSSPSVGSERFGGGLTYRNVTGLGDELSASYNRSFPGGSNALDFSYRLPINAMNGTVQLRVAPNNSRVIEQPFDVLDIRSNTELYELSYRQPLIRNPREEFALSLAFAVQNGRTTISGIPLTTVGSGTDIDGQGRTRVLKFGQDYTKRDRSGAWALRSQFSLGLNAFDATVSDTSKPDGRFFSWLGQMQRVQRLSNNQLLIAQADVQLSHDPLLPSQQFVIGGGQSLRGYRQNLRSGDNGARFSVENRIALQRDQIGNPIFQLVPFVDAGWVWNQSQNPAQLASETFLASAGLGLIWEPMPRFLVRVDYGIPLIYNSDRKDNAQDRGLNFSLGYSF